MTLRETAIVAAAAVALISALLTISARVPLRAAMALLLHVISLGVLYLTLNAELLAAVQLLVYAGAVVTLFIFVLMMVGASTEKHRAVTFAGVGAAALMGVVGTVLSLSMSSSHGKRPSIALCTGQGPDCRPFGGVEELGLSLFKDSVVPFELIGILLLVAAVASMAVASSKPDQVHLKLSSSGDDLHEDASKTKGNSSLAKKVGP